MSTQVIIALTVEFALILVTTLLLAQPRMIFEKRSESFRSSARMGGFFLLSLTFCWSFVLGCVLALNSMTMTIRL